MAPWHESRLISKEGSTAMPPSFRVQRSQNLTRPSNEPSIFCFAQYRLYRLRQLAGPLDT